MLLLTSLKFWNQKHNKSFEDAGFKNAAPFPHCDPRVLHSPGACEVCDHYPHYQELRNVWGINFTSENFVYAPALSDYSWRMLPCPSDFNRGLGGAHEWCGNRPVSKQSNRIKLHQETLD